MIQAGCRVMSHRGQWHVPPGQAQAPRPCMQDMRTALHESTCQPVLWPQLPPHIISLRSCRSVWYSYRRTSPARGRIVVDGVMNRHLFYTYGEVSEREYRSGHHKNVRIAKRLRKLGGGIVAGLQQLRSQHTPELSAGTHYICRGSSGMAKRTS